MNRLKDKVANRHRSSAWDWPRDGAAFRKAGAKVAITDVREAEGKEVAKQINTEGGAAGYWRLNVAREAEVQTVFAAVWKRFGRIDVVVNNAGIAGANKPTDEITEEEWD